METLHATCVVLDGKGILLCGPPDCGKSDLALRLIDEGAVLVSDDLVALRASGEAVIATFPDVPDHLKGVMEVRGLGLVNVPCQDETKVELAIELSGHVERMPHPVTRKFLGIDVRTLTLNAFEASAPAKIRLALRNVLVAA